MTSDTLNATAFEAEDRHPAFATHRAGRIPVVTWLMGLGLVALFASPASASAVPPSVFAAAGDAFLTLLGVSGLAVLTARSERWHPRVVVRRR